MPPPRKASAPADSFETRGWKILLAEFRQATKPNLTRRFAQDKPPAPAAPLLLFGLVITKLPRFHCEVSGIQLN